MMVNKRTTILSVLLLIMISVMAQTGSVYEQYLANVTAFANLSGILRADLAIQRRIIAAGVVLESAIND